MVYRCRAAGTRRLICLNAAGPASDGREFTKETAEAAEVEARTRTDLLR